MGLWHGVLTVSLCGLMHMEVPEKLFILTLPESVVLVKRSIYTIKALDDSSSGLFGSDTSRCFTLKPLIQILVFYVSDFPIICIFQL